MQKAKSLFALTEQESEALANKAGLSLSKGKNGVAAMMAQYRGRYCDLINKAAVSERMLQYYIAGREPTKQSLLAIAICLGLSLGEIQRLLGQYGYCLSRSLPNDAIVQWFIENKNVNKSVPLRYQINEVLGDLGLPVLMTKLYNS